MKTAKNTELFKNKTVIGVLCVVVGLLVGCVIVPAVNNATNSTASVIRAKANITAGEKITDAMLETVQVGSANLPSGVKSSKKNVVGKYAAQTIDKDDMITEAKISASNSAYDLKDGQKLMSIKISDFAAGLSGKLQAGDIISIYIPPTNSNSQANSSSETTTAAEPVLPPELQYVKIAAVTASNGKDTGGEAVQSASSDDSSSTLPSTITVYVSDTQAKVLATNEQKTTHVALVCRGNDTKAADFLTKQADINSQESGTSINKSVNTSAETTSGTVTETTK